LQVINFLIEQRTLLPVLWTVVAVHY